MKILGINYLSESSISFLKNGKVEFAISEERLNRIKNWYGNPYRSIKHFLRIKNIDLDEIDFIATHGLISNPKLINKNKKEYNDKKKLINNSNLSRGEKKYLISKLDLRKKKEILASKRARELIDELQSKLKKKIYIYDHHKCHAATASYYSGWDDCYCLTIDGWGDNYSSKLFKFKNGKLTQLRATSLLNSLGYFYGSITKLLGFTPHRHEGKVLGLAAFGDPNKAINEISKMISFDKVKKNFVSHPEKGLYLPLFDNKKLNKLLNNFSKKDIAAATQHHLEKIVTDYILSISSRSFKLVLAGGVFSNVKLNQKIAEIKRVKDIFVFPNMGDGGLCVGAAALCYSQKKKINSTRLKNYYLGSSYSNKEIKKVLDRLKLKYISNKDLEKIVSKKLSENKIVAIFQGKMEFGPRSLGNRSILASTNDFRINKWLNQKLGRTEFMPFAPITIDKYATKMYKDFKKGKYTSKFMTRTYNCTTKMKKIAPATVHIDGTARPQIIDKFINKKMYKILTEYYKLTKNPNLINTSFNMHEEPIVCSPEDAARSFIRSKIDYLYIGDFFVKNKK